MFEKKLYTLCVLLFLSCSAYAMEEGIDKDKSSFSLASAPRSTHNLKKFTNHDEERAERLRLQALAKVETRAKKTLLSELEKHKAQAAKGAKFTPLELLRMASVSAPFH